MLWTEFLANTKCRDTEYNHKVYKDLEILYMNSNLTHEDIYDYGRKLVDNSFTPVEIEYIKTLKFEIIRYRNLIREQRQSIKDVEARLTYETDDFWIKHYKAVIKCAKDDIRYYKLEIGKLKFTLGSMA